MTIHRLALSCFLLLFLSLGLPPTAVTDEFKELTPALRERLAVIHQGTRSVQGDFEQEKRLSMFDRTFVSMGVFAVKQPGKIHWAYQEPSAFGFASDGEQVRRWNEHSGMSAPSPLARDPILSVIVDQMLAWSTMDAEKLEASFTLAVPKTTPESTPETAPLTLELLPRTRQLAAVLQRVQVSFDRDETHLQEIVLFEPDGDTTRIRFFNVRVNEDVSPGLF
ncbi:outer membrane lipoprotein carrier protein LolA [Desulfonatronum lacustre]|uniref:outer membrane lipoprotein carrier protein LolA n=1 Tax=Desulfonatronum lacustre TaxID=66849 RepID=UPI00048BAB8F|nr:outer membrane lipoprotein carrier protein LolA [Desulfonatronum lacustre]SMP46371.1 Outer membrane lipoprotein-sorting protein [Desulfonatronum zhilinae]